MLTRNAGLQVGHCCKLPRDSGKQSVMVYKNGGRK